ncbi:MAG: phosphate ABC transporter substrate-binding protein PstS [Candidatus Nanopelagicales bacterium]
MKLTRPVALAATLTAGVLVLAACSSGSDSGSTTSGAAGSADCVSGSIKASGSSAQANAMTEWINGYQTQCPDATIEYQPNGSGAGVQDFINAQTSFAGSDSAIKDEDLTKATERCSAGPAINIPMVGGAIAVAYNLEGVDSLVMTPDVIAGIFANTITKWNDPAIADLNPGATLPDASIAQFHRSDSSGTTDNFTKYLAAAAPTAWTFEPGKDWLAPGGQGSKGSDGVTSSVKSTPNSIGYVELSYIQDAGLGAVAVDNGGGAVEATSENAATTISAAEVTGTGNDLTLSLDYTIKEANAYPIVLLTYEITCEKGLPADQLDLTKSFLKYAASDGQSILTEIGYVPITGDLLTKVQASVDALSS